MSQVIWFQDPVIQEYAFKTVFWIGLACVMMYGLVGFASQYIDYEVRERLKRMELNERELKRREVIHMGEARVKKVRVGLMIDGDEPTFTGFEVENMPLDKVRRIEKAIMPYLDKLIKVIYSALN